MADTYSIERIRRLRGLIDEADLHHRGGLSRHEPGDVLEFGITGVCPATQGTARMEVDKFIGGGFAGQVYRVRLLSLDLSGDPIPGLTPGGLYAVKIIIPPSGFSLLFRDAIYRMAYQGPFSAQVNPSAARAGVLWQKMFRQGAKIKFGDERAIVDTYATFFDPGLGSYGEINEWVEGRNWMFEIDLRIFQRGRTAPEDAEYSHEYLAKKRFMAQMVELCHEMGAPEFARQYEWSTCKSQPNVLKRVDADADPSAGLTAIDFRAGLALLPFLPMSPGDFRLIGKGLARGDLVQFDRGNLEKLQGFIDQHAETFEDLAPAIAELKQRDPEYRASLPDIAHHGLRLLYDAKLRRSVKEGFVESWTAKGYIDKGRADGMRKSFLGFWMFFILGALPLLGKMARRCWGVATYRRHIGAFLTSPSYTMRVLRVGALKALMGWHRSGKLGEEGVDFYLRHPALFVMVRILPGLLPLPAKWHRMLIDWKFAWTTIKDAVLYPIRFYRDADFRVAWLTGEIESGADEGMLTEEEKAQILGRVHDPYIQKYLKCVAVHICTLPVTQVVAVIVAAWYFFTKGDSWEQSTAYAIGVLTIFQVLPFSPGSFCRGTYVVYLMIKERNVRNYWLAVMVSYWHYIGYLGFPLQMVAEFPALARFMGGRWATKMVHVIPVFGERGALLEHWIFDFFFNVPLTVKRRFTDRRNSAASATVETEKASRS